MSIPFYVSIIYCSNMVHYNHVIRVNVFQSTGNTQSYLIPDFWTRRREKQAIPKILKICRLLSANILFNHAFIGRSEDLNN